MARSLHIKEFLMEEERLKRLLADIADRLMQPVSKGQMYAFYLIAIIAVVVGISSGISVSKHAENLTKHSEAVIQNSRRHIILESCEEQDARNRSTIEESLRDHLQISNLINAVVPYRNCQEVLNKAGF